MKIYISMDIEGVAGVSSAFQGQRGNPDYELARRLMTAEANAAAAGAFRGGATAVTVADSHGSMQNLVLEDIDPRVRVVSGSRRPVSMVAGLDRSHDGLVLIGYHAAAGRRGVLAHTISSAAFRHIDINGMTTGEPTLFAGHAAELGVPLLAASGDDCLATEIEAQFPGAARIVTKSTISAEAVDSMAPAAARALIEEQVRSAVERAGDCPVTPPCRPPHVVTVEFLRQTYADAAALLPWIERRDVLSVTFTVGSFGDAASILSALSIMAAAPTQ
ncbi:M55 family metallopeptidase [Mesorhizobium marinum]|uniref:M55 family metallopeptidase n=1 Tax=Mesorhizobium marinum TaxID=3228790 RepID=UPI0034666E1D